VIQCASYARGIVARVQRDSDDRDAVNRFSLPPSDPVSRVDAPGWVIRKSGEYFHIVATFKQTAGESEAFGRGLRIEPLVQNQDAHDAVLQAASAGSAMR